MAEPVYKVTDADGDVTFTDTPPLSGDSTVEEHSIQTPNFAKPTEMTRTPAAPVEAEESTRYDTRIVTPANNSTIPMGPGNFTVQAALNPPLAPDENLQPLLDGEPVGARSESQTGSSLTFTAANTDYRWFASMRVADSLTHRPQARCM
jgi:hypothetical protein